MSGLIIIAAFLLVSYTIRVTAEAAHMLIPMIQNNESDETWATF